jgi:PAS domain S-box-containing protein
VPGNDAVPASWRAALLSDGHGLPVLAIRGGRVHEMNLAARALFGERPAGARLDDLFDERAGAKVRAFLEGGTSKGGTSGRTVELVVVHGDAPPTAVTFLRLDAPGEQLLVGQCGTGYTEAIAEKLIAAHSHLANTMRELAKAKDTEHRLRAEVEALGRASSAVVEAVADLPGEDVSAVLHMVALHAQTLTLADYVAIGIGNDPERPFQHWVYVGMSPDVARAIGRVPRPVGVLGRVARNGEVIRMGERHDDRFGALPEHHPEVGSFLGVPIRHRGRAVGNIYVANRPGRAAFSEQDERVTRMLAARVAAAVETASLYVRTSLQRAWLQNVIDQMPDGVLLYDEAGRLKATNQGVAALSCADTGATDPLGNPILIDLRDPDGRALPAERWPLARALERHEIVREEMLAYRRSGELTPVAVSAGPVLEVSGELSGAMVIVQDISVRKELERLREEWSAVVAHDLRQPVNAIHLDAQMLLRRKEDTLPEPERRALSRIVSSSRRLNRMIADLLDASRIESKHMTIEPRPVALDTYVRAVVDELAETLAGRRVRVAVAPEQVISIDRDRIQQVLANLVSNAVKYGAPETEIAIEAQPCGEMVEVVVTNHGPGIPPDQLPLLFSRFSRTRGARESRVPGIGLGLYVAKGLVEAHGGRLWAESTPGETTRFHFTLPRVAPRRSGAPGDRRA